MGALVTFDERMSEAAEGMPGLPLASRI